MVEKITAWRTSDGRLFGVEAYANDHEYGERIAMARAAFGTGSHTEFFIVDLREEWARRPYVSFWRPNDAGYAYSLPWSGRYSKETVDRRWSYYNTNGRFPVACSVVEALADPRPAPRIIDGDVGPVVPNNSYLISAMKALRYHRPECFAAEQEEVLAEETDR
jgi:hypothetical protein